MKKILMIALFALTANISAQGAGFNIGYSTGNVLTIDGIYEDKKDNRFHLGYSQEQDGQFPETRSVGTSNFGQSALGGSDYYSVVNIGYSREVVKKLTVGAEFSVGNLVNYTNYSDRRFTEGGYKNINSKESATGFGGNLGYKFHDLAELTVGYNTIKGVTFGWILMFHPYKN